MEWDVYWVPQNLFLKFIWSKPLEPLLWTKTKSWIMTRGGGKGWKNLYDFMTLKSENKQYLVPTLNRNTCSVVRGLVYIDLVVRKVKLATDITDISLNHCFGSINQQMDILKKKSKWIFRKISLTLLLYSIIYCVGRWKWRP